MFIPVEFSGVYYAAADDGGGSLHVFGGGVGDNVSSPLERSAVDGSSKGIVHDEGNSVCVGCFCETLYVKDRKGGVGDGLAEYRLGVRPEGRLKFLVGTKRIHESDFHAHPGHGHRKKIEGSSVDCSRGYDVIAVACDVEY